MLDELLAELFDKSLELEDDRSIGGGVDPPPSSELVLELELLELELLELEELELLEDSGHSPCVILNEVWVPLSASNCQPLGLFGESIGHGVAGVADAT